MYIKGTISFKRRNDIEIFDECKLESIFVKPISDGKSTLVGEIHPVCNTKEEQSILKFERILKSLPIVIQT